MLDIKGLSVKAGQFAVEAASLMVGDSGFHVILGPTGSGKTVLLETIMGFKAPSGGRIYLDGADITGLPPEKRKISYLPQDLALFPHLTAGENIRYALNAKKTGGVERRQLVDELVEAVGIRHILDRNIKNLSGGERQRVALVRALATGNRYMLLDEPFSALHEGMKKDLWFLLRGLQARYGLSVVMITHDLSEAFFLGETISVIIDGMVRQTGRKEDVYKHPASVDIARFFGIGNLFEATVVAADGRGVTQVRSDELNCALSFNSAVFSAPGERVVIGIRAEDVKVLRPDQLRPGQSNLLSGEIKEVFYKGSMDTVLFVPDSSTRTIEIELHISATRKLQLSKGAKTTVTLRSENIFCIGKKISPSADAKPSLPGANFRITNGSAFSGRLEQEFVQYYYFHQSSLTYPCRPFGYYDNRVRIREALEHP